MARRSPPLFGDHGADAALNLSLAAQTETRLSSTTDIVVPTSFIDQRIRQRPAVVFMLGGIGSTARSTRRISTGSASRIATDFWLYSQSQSLRNLISPRTENNISFWEMKGSRTHRLAAGAPPVDDDGYLMAVLAGSPHRDHGDRKRVFLRAFRVAPERYSCLRPVIQGASVESSPWQRR